MALSLCNARLSVYATFMNRIHIIVLCWLQRGAGLLINPAQFFLPRCHTLYFHIPNCFMCYLFICVATLKREQGRSLGHLNPQMTKQVCLSWSSVFSLLSWNMWCCVILYVSMHSAFIPRLEWMARLLEETGVPHSFHFLLSHLFMWFVSVLRLRGAITQHLCWLT